ncbi:hypothetical protein FisN_25Hh029 [Fistulifera solaris]|jgi:hypothetical protein|uniref:Uncharacterized protein n=1 Tax=Fistulifera solaris TaxID=1519565 RepID=A0A1Z5JVH8_FISSO|nr:hypothetical protein FisN_25Hh029 [Fistulifera solaris]|eukprot:GAX18055.1 hypothetical protein FisN_25Hh029 [Fistulifera solaris]
MEQPAVRPDLLNTATPAEDDLVEHRLQHGQCGSCGQQLYGFEMESSCCFAALFSKKRNELTMNPLTIPNLVEHGKCLKCNISPHASNHSEEPSEASNPATNTTTNRVEQDARKEPPKAKKSLSFKKAPLFQRATVAGAAYVPHEESGVMIPISPSQSNSSSSSSSSNLAIYQGDYNAKGERHGYGTITWTNGDVYKGSFVQNQRHGHGILVFASPDAEKPDNGEYVGDWKENLMHGEGTRRYPNGDVYVGYYEQGKRHGHGEFYYANGDTYSGPWEKNHMQGIGRYYYMSGQLFEGMFLMSKRNGKGKIERTDGSVDYFQYVDDVRVGYGVRWNGDRSLAWKLALLQPFGAIRAEPISLPEATLLLEELEKMCDQHVQTMMLTLILE